MGCACAAALSQRPRRKSTIGGARKRAAAPAPPPAPPAFDARALCAAQTSNAGAFAPLAVPAAVRGAAAGGAWFRAVALDDVFPGSGVGEAFATSAAFRRALREAARSDVVEDSPVRRDLAASAQGSWRVDAAPATAAALGAALGAGAPGGAEFYRAIAGLELAGARPSTGHFIEVVGGPGATRTARHSWHQDRADAAATTVVLGFPREDAQVGPGVFSHLVPLSHTVALDAREEDAAGPREYDPPDRLGVAEVPDASVVRPSFGRGAEILVYSDATTLHSGPDVIYRDGLWRFM